MNQPSEMPEEARTWRYRDCDDPAGADESESAPGEPEDRPSPHRPHPSRKLPRRPPPRRHYED